jgi:hypothetical protein
VAVTAGLGGAALGEPQANVQMHAGIDYEYEADSSRVMREHVGDPSANPSAPLPVQNDLSFKQFRHRVTPKVELDVGRTVFFTAALPVVITQARELRLDTGVTRATSSTVIDNILPMQGYDARDPGSAPPGDLMWRGVARHGLDTLDLGIGFSPMSQLTDDTKPTWRVGAEAHIAVGGVMRLDPTAPQANTAVGYGVHELKLWTTFEKRLGWARPWTELWWQVPLASTSSSLFQDPGFGSTNTQKGQQAGASFGIEVFAVDDAVNDNHIGIDVGTRMIAHFEGRDYSEMWEPFAYAGNSTLQLDADPTQAGIQPRAYPGISNIENYLETAARVALRARIGAHGSFAVIGDAIWKTDHTISFADSGVDLPTCTSVRTTHCEMNDNDVVNPGTAEVNPLHKDLIDLVGHRYRSVNNIGFIIGVQGQVVF